MFLSGLGTKVMLASNEWEEVPPLQGSEICVEFVLFLFQVLGRICPRACGFLCEDFNSSAVSLVRNRVSLIDAVLLSNLCLLE